VDNFPQTFYVGGMVRDLLLLRQITDVDITTKATPDEVIKILTNAGISVETKHKQFGVVVAKKRNYLVEIATFRKDSYNKNRYPKITFASTPKQDSSRRDFTVNALYLSTKHAKVTDFYNGLRDLKLKQLKLIGNPKKRLVEDPLRIVRALRFAKTLDLKLEPRTKKAIENNFSLVKTLTNSRIESELKKIKNLKQKKFVATEVDKQILLDKK
jgi:tRNA nucleotidyltransferase (CCA-adding enzyme)